METRKSPVCIYCGLGDDQVPLLSMIFHGENYFICPTHLPVLIHKPSLLRGRLPGVENLQPGKDPED